MRTKFSGRGRRAGGRHRLHSRNGAATEFNAGELLGRRDARIAVDTSARGVGGCVVVGLAGSTNELSSVCRGRHAGRWETSNPAGTGRGVGNDQESWHKWRRILQRERGASV